MEICGGKRGNCLYQAIFPFPTLFPTAFENFLPSSSNLILSSANSFSFEESKIGCLGKGEMPSLPLTLSSGLIFSSLKKLEIILTNW